MSLTPGTIISHYRIISLFGAGGMGEVYLAEDVRLGRKIALKLLAVEFTKDQDRVRRFELEARAASALSHPNIITIFDIGRTQHGHYITTEFIEGETLRQRMRRERLPLGETLTIAIQVASALVAAHSAGIVHRDIKPENIMLRPDGYVKVLDFGIAKLTESFPDPSVSQDSATLAAVSTEPGVIMGSPNYMSPEQARGLSVDHRTDVFSFGVMLYEMLTGERPFNGETTSDIIVAVLDRDPPPMSRYAPDVPQKLEDIISRALIKDKHGRCQTVEEIRRVLKRQKQKLDFEKGLDPSVSAMPDDDMSTTFDASVERAVAAPVPEKKAARESTTHTLHLATARATSDVGDVTTQIKRLKGGLALAIGLLVLALAAVAYITWGSRQQSISSLAVLPFVNASDDPTMDYISDGLTESLINNLSQSLNLKVMSRNSVFRYKGKEVEAREVGRELGVRSVLIGRISERSDGLSLSVELADTEDNSHIWGEKYNIGMADLLSVQEEISRQIADKLRL
ncbi:MAG TPA: serine/threonine-protein kinase, partial [Blastocatellia bacterium]|nr:serine/threonine-protein kinase [Blastocatellia bacterium]